MPFQSEAQRRYLWANEPEIARDWTDTYGSRIQKSNGGIMHNFANYAHDDGSNVSVPRSFQARPHSDQVNLAYITPEEQGILQALKPDTPHEGPMGIPNYDSFDAAGNYTRSENIRDTGPKAGTARNEAQVFHGAGIGQPITTTTQAQQQWEDPLNQANRQAIYDNWKPDSGMRTQMYNPRSKWGIGNLFRGAMSMFGGVPGSIMSMLSRIDPRQLRGKNPDGSWRTQAQYEQARAERQLRNRIDRLRKTRDIGKYADDPEGWAASDLSGRLSDFENQLGITGIASDINYPGGEPVAPINDYYTGTMSFEDQVAKNKRMIELMGFEEAVPPKNWNFDSTLFDPSQGGIMNIDTETTEEPLPLNDPFAGDAEETILEKAKRINAEIKTPLAEKVDTHPYTGESFRPKTGRNYEWLYGLQNEYGIPRTFIRDYDKRNEPYPFINYHPDDEEISIMRGY